MTVLGTAPDGCSGCVIVNVDGRGICGEGDLRVADGVELVDELVDGVFEEDAVEDEDDEGVSNSMGRVFVCVAS